LAIAGNPITGTPFINPITDDPGGEPGHENGTPSVTGIDIDISTEIGDAFVEDECPPTIGKPMFSSGAFPVELLIDRSNNM
jgi:hypothetical protein